jgi:hypothetical protein
VADGIPDGYVSVAEAARRLNQTTAALTRRLRLGTLAGKKVQRGRRQIWAVEASELRKAAPSADHVAQETVMLAGADGVLSERNSVLYEVLRRRRIIDEQLAAIDRCRVVIDEQRSEIEALLLSPPAIPNN